VGNATGYLSDVRVNPGYGRGNLNLALAQKTVIINSDKVAIAAIRMHWRNSCGENQG
jgi:hypothetical protein